MKEKLSGDEAVLMFEKMQEKSLLTWYVKWRDRPWLYAVVKVLKKLPIYILVAMILSFNKIKLFIANPIAYFEQRGVFIIILMGVFIILYRISWNNNAVKYYFLSKINKEFPGVDPDHLIAQKGRRVEATAASKYEKWFGKKLTLQITLGLALPLAFFTLLYTLRGIVDGEWSLNNFFTNGFESVGLIVVIIATFILCGIALGYSLWRQVKDDYLLMNKAKVTR